MFKKAAEERGEVLLTTPVSSCGEVVGGLCAHQWGVGASVQEGWRWQVLKAFRGPSLSESEGQTQVTSWSNCGSRLPTQNGGQEKQASRGSEIKHPLCC